MLTPCTHPATHLAAQRTQVLAHTAAQSAAERLRALIEAQCDLLPLPGGGHTLARWQALAEVAGHDLSLAKLYEGHTDALAILQELKRPDLAASPNARWGTWAAEAPGCRVMVQSDGTLRGTKAWCSGAAHLTHALLTAWQEGCDAPQLVAVDLRHPSVAIDTGAWHAIGMAGTGTAAVHFDDVPALRVGSPGQYLTRPGFWHGGGGIAACWHGGTCAIGQALRSAARAAAAQSPAGSFRLAALGDVDVALSAGAALLREAAQWIDAHPQADASRVALRARQSAERVARHVLDTVARELGPAPFCRDAGFARMASDLPVFIRQSHGDRDDASLGQRVCDGESTWPL